MSAIFESGDEYELDPTTYFQSSKH
ncbi:hypothetical protein DFA_03739 [Cavenderia fasciculata]|uniref:Uncharacterized protein n=1 Tax=Cavenderia fasciculata TaxID=261658 RepID=F4Q0A1_CACFS|nr:hypothetical protein DFA_03739 [Cavenderia fasciculata]EGG18252.1 hypothetical protein DFA_03739 [Cavenderia fasciculata]|eukprot:XP_004357075.1 hypothetical protein DFA_03739 [Cavenderia fasciculata]